MSIHKSLRSRTALARHRNVITRAERVEKLLRLGRWNESDSVFGLAKTKIPKRMKRVKTKAAKEDEEVTEAAAE